MVLSLIHSIGGSGMLVEIVCGSTLATRSSNISGPNIHRLVLLILILVLVLDMVLILLFRSIFKRRKSFEKKKKKQIKVLH
jgi:hypothetical protein